MAKISAHGEEKAAEWKDPSGCRLVLTSGGRVLRNYLKGDGLSTCPAFTMRGARNRPTVDEVEEYAQRLGFVRI